MSADLLTGTSFDPEPLRQSILRHIHYTLARPESAAVPRELFKPVSLAIHDFLIDGLLKTEERYRNQKLKRLCYLSMEFLMGRWLSDNLCNLRLNEPCRSVLAEFGISLEDVLQVEPDAGLGNGGLGRLAACFLESLATLGMPGFGYGIDYEYGMFKQEIAGGFQREKPDQWKSEGTPFYIERPLDVCPVELYGHLQSSRDSHGNRRQSWVDTKIVLGVPNDMPVAGFNGVTVNFLRLFAARASEDFDIEIFNRGDYIRAIEQKIASENISRVLYPSDSVLSGKELRLIQEYFLVACSLRDMLRHFAPAAGGLDDLPNKVAVQMNDTHPSLCCRRADAAPGGRASCRLGQSLGDYRCHAWLHQSHPVAGSAGKMADLAAGARASAAHGNHFWHQPPVPAHRGPPLAGGIGASAPDVDH